MFSELLSDKRIFAIFKKAIFKNIFQIFFVLFILWNKEYIITPMKKILKKTNANTQNCNCTPACVIMWSIQSNRWQSRSMMIYLYDSYVKKKRKEGRYTSCVDKAQTIRSSLRWSYPPEYMCARASYTWTHIHTHIQSLFCPDRTEETHIQHTPTSHDNPLFIKILLLQKRIYA